MVMTERDLDIEREILEAVKAMTSGFGHVHFAKPDDVYNRTMVSLNPFPRSEFPWRLGLLEEKRQISKIGQNVAPEFGFGIELTDKGKHRLSMPEADYRMINERSPSTTVHQSTFYGPVGNVAHSSGPNASIVQSAQLNPDVTRLLEQVFTEIRNHPSATPEEKKDAEIEARQLQLELSKSSPNLEKVKIAISLIAAVSPIVLEILKHVK
jgi:hypothetical protein